MPHSEVFIIRANAMPTHESMMNSPPPAPTGSHVARRYPLLVLLCVLVLYHVIQALTSLLSIHSHLPLSAEVRAGGWVRAFDHHAWQMVLALGVIGSSAVGDGGTGG